MRLKFGKLSHSGIVTFPRIDLGSDQALFLVFFHTVYKVLNSFTKFTLFRGMTNTPLIVFTYHKWGIIELPFG